MDNLSRKFSSEQTLDNSEILQFWAKVEQGTLKSTDGLDLAYAKIKHPDNRRAIVISSGRVESYLKYQELMFDCYQQGFSVYAIDHRGQGLSSRLTVNPHQGHVNDFNDYVADFELFIKNIVKKELHNELFLVGHSMGAAIGTHYLAQVPETFKAAIFSAPMYGIKLPLPTGVIRLLAQKISTIAKLDNSNKVAANYILGGKDYQAISFKTNQLTHSKLRYQSYRNLYEAQPQCQLGSPTNHWLYEAINAAKLSIDLAKNSQIPILILQAGNDSIVCNSAQHAALGPNCSIVRLEKAFHEMFIEIDSIRSATLNHLFDFISQHSTII
jgi:lysophospholipase